MPRHTEKRHLPYTPEQMFDLVADVGRYQEFLPWVAATRVRSDSESEMVADLVVGFGSLKETFTSRVRKVRPSNVTVDYIEGPLKFLHNEWAFASDGAGGCDIDFCVDFAFKSRIFETLAGQFFDRALRRMTAAFEARAHALYGAASSSTGAGSVTGSNSSSAQSAA